MNPLTDTERLHAGYWAVLMKAASVAMLVTGSFYGLWRHDYAHATYWLVLATLADNSAERDATKAGLR